MIARIGGAAATRGTTIAPKPIRIFEVFVFEDEAAAERAASKVHDFHALDGVRGLGPVVVVHYSIKLGDRLGPVGLPDEELLPVAACVREVGYT